MIPGIVASISVAAAAPSNVSLLHFDGEDGSTSVVDVEGNAWPVTGNAHLDTSQKKFGTASLRLDGTGDFIDRNAANLAFGTADFTIEFWVRLAAQNQNCTFMDNRFGGGGDSLVLYDSSGTADQVPVTFYAADANRASSASLVAGTWQFIALSRSEGVSRLFIDGVQAGSDYADGNNYANTGLRFGHGATANSGSAGGVNGWIDELRITKGVGRYSANFTPPTEAFISS